MDDPTLFGAPDEDDPDKNPDDREKQGKPPRNNRGGEYILHFRDDLGRFCDPPDERASA